VFVIKPGRHQARQELGLVNGDLGWLHV